MHGETVKFTVNTSIRITKIQNHSTQDLSQCALCGTLFVPLYKVLSSEEWHIKLQFVAHGDELPLDRPAC
jgi:hypothetical protein